MPIEALAPFLPAGSIQHAAHARAWLVRIPKLAADLQPKAWLDQGGMMYHGRETLSSFSIIICTAQSHAIRSKTLSCSSIRLKVQDHSVATDTRSLRASHPT